MARYRPNDHAEARWVAPPGWPQPPQGWSPPPGWQPDPAWGPTPARWAFWQDGFGRPVPARGQAAPEAAEAVYLPFWPARHVRDTSPRFKKTMTAVVALIGLLFVIGLVGDSDDGSDTVRGGQTASEAANQRPAPSVTPDASREATSAPTAESTPAPTPPTRDQLVQGGAEHRAGGARLAGRQGTRTEDRLRPGRVRAGLGRHRPQRLRHPQRHAPPRPDRGDL